MPEFKRIFKITGRLVAQLALASLLVIAFSMNDAHAAKSGDSVCNIRARMILVGIARNVRTHGNIYERQAFPELSASDRERLDRLSIRNIKVFKKFFRVLDPYMKEVIAEAVYPMLNEDELKQSEPKFVAEIYRFKNNLLEGRANVPPPSDRGKSIILERKD